MLGATIEPRSGEEVGPMDGFLLAGDCRNVLMGDLERGGGIRILCRSLRIAVGSGIVPGRTSACANRNSDSLTYFRLYPCHHSILLNPHLCVLRSF